jgi:hypothetical protein
VLAGSLAWICTDGVLQVIEYTGEAGVKEKLAGAGVGNSVKFAVVEQPAEVTIVAE